MSQHSKRSVEILNPPSGKGFTTRRSAKRYVERGLARWSGERSIEFLTADHRFAAEPQASAVRPHSLSLQIQQLVIGRYRNDVLGLPNFVGFVPDRGTHGRSIA